jgi:hypothetical protein
MNDDPTDLTLTNVGEVKWYYLRLYDGKSGELIADFDSSLTLAVPESSPAISITVR